MKRTKIVCTIGPSSNNEKILTQMIKAGMNVARLNFSHGTYAEHLKVIKLIRKASAKLGQPITILQDLQGPRIRLGEIPKGGFVLQPKDTVILATTPKAKFARETKKTLAKIPVTYNKMHLDVKKGQRLLLVDGLITLKVLRVKAREIYCEVQNGGLIESHKGINLPETDLSIAPITEKDKRDLDFGIKNEVDMVAMSFVRSETDVNNLKRLIEKLEKKYFGKHAVPTQVVVKIEKPEAVKNFSKILKITDGVMVARGDLGIEMPPDKVPLIQKKIIEDCLAASKPVIVATQMLDSMIYNPKPTRAEVSDVANAVIDHTDAVMLSGETANGKYPVETVKIMSKIVIRTEKSKYDDLDFIRVFKNKVKLDEAISSSANLLVKKIKPQAILVATITGHTGRIVSRYRPELPILISTNNEKVKRQLNLSWGVIPFLLPKCKTIEELTEKALAYIKLKKWVKSKDVVIIISGFPLGQSGNVNWIKIHEVS
ncbi:MAG TPA: pyruvate kinase [Candidatus Uhrbacteria bacterium]|nr:pyruvate kinase [Candidatus Uhrbacteria bacterium]